MREIALKEQYVEMESRFKAEIQLKLEEQKLQFESYQISHV